jgi:peptidoglycan/LPS O-acetylase OafA/YrhL
MSVPPATLAVRRRLGRLVADAAAVAERLAFWAGVALPCLHLPVLAVYGVTPDTTPVLLALWALHAAALLAGRRHSPEERRDQRDRRARRNGADDRRAHPERSTDP